MRNGFDPIESTLQTMHRPRRDRPLNKAKELLRIAFRGQELFTLHLRQVDGSKRSAGKGLEESKRISLHYRDSFAVWLFMPDDAVNIANESKLLGVSLEVSLFWQSDASGLVDSMVTRRVSEENRWYLVERFIPCLRGGLLTAYFAHAAGYCFP